MANTRPGIYFRRLLLILPLILILLIPLNAAAEGATAAVVMTADYLQVEFLGKTFEAEMSRDGELLQDLTAISPDGTNQMVIYQGTRVLDKNLQAVKLIRVTESSMPPLAKDEAGVSRAYSFEPSGTHFTRPIDITLGYGIDQVPRKIVSIGVAYYSEERGWVKLETGGTLATAGQAAGAADHFSTFAVIARRSPAVFQLDNLSVTPTVERTWSAVPFLVCIGQKARITVEAANEGGMAGNCQAILNLNGQEAGRQGFDLNPDQCRELTFNLEGLAPGDYSVELGGLREDLTVKRLYNVYEISGFALLLAAIISALVMGLRQRRLKR